MNLSIHDLHIGSLVELNGLYVHVLEIFDNALKTTDHRTRCAYYISEFKPIELNENTFKMIVKDDNIDICDSFRTFYIFANTECYTFSVNEYPYIHQLQSLYKSLLNKNVGINIKKAQ